MSLCLLGDENPSTLTSMGNLAVLYQNTGRAAEAVALYAECLAARRRVLGDEHTETLTSMYNLAGLYAKTGRVAEAAVLYEENLRGLLGRGDLEEAAQDARTLLRLLERSGLPTAAVEALCAAHGCACR